MFRTFGHILRVISVFAIIIHIDVFIVIKIAHCLRNIILDHVTRMQRKLIKDRDSGKEKPSPEKYP